MSRNKTNSKNPWWFVLINIAICVMVFMLVLTCAIAYENASYSGAYTTEVSTLQYRIEYGDYERLMEYTSTNRMNDVGIGDPVYEECYAVADYYKAAAFYKVYVTTNQPQKAQKYLEDMERAKKSVGLYKDEIEKINQQLGL